MNCDILDLLNYSITPRHFRFPLANPQSVSIVDCVPQLNLCYNMNMLHIYSANLQQAVTVHQQIA